MAYKLCLDLEWGQIYGAYRGDVLPAELGIAILNEKYELVDFISRVFAFDIAIIMRRNLTDGMGQKIGLHEFLFQGGKVLNSPIDASQKLSAIQRQMQHSKIVRLAADFKRTFSMITSVFPADELILFGGMADLQILRRMGVRLHDYHVIDIQAQIRNRIEHTLSLDKLEYIFALFVNERVYGSRHMRLTLPRYKYPGQRLKIHTAVGDALRMHVLLLEFLEDQDRFSDLCMQYRQVYEIVPSVIDAL